MSALLVGASSQRLVNAAAPITAHPMTVGMWFNGTTFGSNLALFSLAASASTHALAIIVSSGQINLRSVDGGGTSNAPTVVISPVAGTWYFIVARFIATNNRKFALLGPQNRSHGSTTTSNSPTGLNRLSIGSLEGSSPSSFFDGRVAEFWITNTDIQADGAQLRDQTLNQLAYGGPFSIPHIAKDIVEYRSLRVHPDSRGDQQGEVFHGKFGRQAWGNTNGVTTGPHPPLPYWYVKPNQVRRQLVI